MAPQLILLLTTAIGASTVLLGEIVLRSVEPFPLLCIRFFFASLLLALLKPRDIFPLKQSGIRGGIAIGTSFGVGCTLLYFGLRFIHAGRANFLISLEVLVVPLLLYLMKGTKPNRNEWIALPLAGLGLWLLTAVGDSTWSHGDLLLLFSTVSYALYAISLSHFSPNNNSYQLSFVALVSITLVSGFMTLFLNQSVFITPSFPTIAIITYLAVIGSVARFVLQSHAQKTATPTQAALIFALEPVLTATMSMLFLAEHLSVTQLFGGGILVCAAILASLPAVHER